MKKSVKAIAAMAMISGMFLSAGNFSPIQNGFTAVSAESSEGLTNIGGKIYFIGSDGNYLKGWKTVDGKKYFFRKNGSAAKGILSIGGTYYRFSDEGVCLGKITGWMKKNGKRVYLSEGKKLSGWQVIDYNVYYFYDDGTAATGKTILFGNEINFSDKGVWDNTNPTDLTAGDFRKNITESIGDDNYAGSDEGHGILTLYFKDPALYADQIEEWRKTYPFLNIEKADYSLSELQSVADELKLNKKKQKPQGNTHGFCNDPI